MLSDATTAIDPSMMACFFCGQTGNLRLASFTLLQRSWTAVVVVLNKAQTADDNISGDKNPPENLTPKMRKNSYRCYSENGLGGF